jgi:hypothetical protein
LNKPGLFNIDFGNERYMTFNYIKSVTKDELIVLVSNVLYKNTPVKDSADFAYIIDTLNINIDFNKLKNNELKVYLFDDKKYAFDNGDDAVRYIVYKTTDSMLLIKSLDVINDVRINKRNISNAFLEKHLYVLSNVFNRHKRIIMALKDLNNKSIINKISKMSKYNHIPLKESFSKNFLRLALNDEIKPSSISNLTLRDKFKLINLIEYKKKDYSTDAFVIRNGKIHVETNRKTLDHDKLEKISNKLMDSIIEDIKTALNGKIVLLDENIEYGLPISRKQSMGQLPFGTKVTMDSDRISSGIFWKNSWGATDLDLSTVDENGNRTGWGRYSYLSNDQDIKFSGDMTYAPDDTGAMEFMTSSNVQYGLFVNIFNGKTPTQAELIIGDDAKNNWIKNIKIREQISLTSKGMIIGFVKNKTFTVFQGRLNNNTTTFNQNASIISKGSSFAITINELFKKAGVNYSYETVEGDNVIDLRYSNGEFNYSKLENTLNM